MSFKRTLGRYREALPLGRYKMCIKKKKAKKVRGKFLPLI